MSLFSKLLVFFISIVTLIMMDLIWLNGIMRGFYQTQLEPFTRIIDGAFVGRHLPALLVWVLMVAGQLLFVMPQIQTMSLVYQLLLGCAYGLVVYGVYDLTNYAIMPQWSLQLTVVDMLWGITINGFLSVFMRFLSQFFK